MQYSRLVKNIDTIKSMGVISQSFMNSVDGYFNVRAAPQCPIESFRAASPCPIESYSDNLNKQNINDGINTGNY